jgi:flagellar M-ring protein FliF
LLPANVTVVDQTGNLLSEQGKDSSGAGSSLDPNQLKYVQQLQQSVIKQVESIIIPMVGQGNVRAEATADIDFSKIEQAAETYKPNSPPEASAIRSQQTSESKGNGAGASGVPGALSNQPPSPATAPLTEGTNTGPAGATPAGPSQKDATTNYEVDKTVRYEQKAMGGLRRLSVAVLVNYRRTVDKNGKVSVKALSPTEMAQINDLVKEAMGYNKERGDSFSVANSPFDGVDKPSDVAGPVWWRDRDNLPLAMDIAKYLVTGLILLFLYLKIVRPLLRPVMRKLDNMAGPAEPLLNGAGEKARGEGAPGAIDPESGAIVTIESKTGQTYRENLAMAKQLAQDDPRVVANVIKAWLGNE